MPDFAVSPASEAGGTRHEQQDDADTLIIGPKRPRRDWPFIQRRWWLPTAFVVLTVVVVVAISMRQSHRPSTPQRPTAQPPRTSAGPIVGVPAPPLRLGTGRAVDLALTNGLLFVLYDNPPRLVRVSTQSGEEVGQVAVPAGANRLIFGSDGLWVIATKGGQSVLGAYDVNSLRRVADAHVPFAVTAAASTPGQLWLGGSDGLYELDRGAGTATHIAGLDDGVGAIAADPAHDRVLITRSVDGATELAAADPTTLRIDRRVLIALTRVSLAVAVSDVWVAGFGDGSRVLHLDADTLQPHPGGPVAATVGPGAIAWAGQSVIWVGAGSGERLSCIDAGNGEIRARWPAMDGPVVSQPTTAYAINNATVVPLPITRACFPG